MNMVATPLPSRVAAGHRPDLVGPAIRAFLRLREQWDLSDAEARKLLGDVSRTTLHNWRTKPPASLSRDTMERISYLLGIWKGLEILLPQKDRADAWVKQPNAAFGGQSPLERMLAGNVSDLLAVRRYIDHARGGDFC